MRGLSSIIRNRGRGALLFDPGMGKSATAIDYACVMALKFQRPIRVLVLSPLVAVDTWTLQAEEMAAEGIDIWAEALGGSIIQRADALKSRGQGSYEGHQRSHAVLQRGQLASGSPGLLISVVNYDSFSSRAVAYTHRKSGPTRSQLMTTAVKQYRPDLIIADESHLLRGPNSNTSKSIARLVEVCSRRLILTGTPMPHSPLDIYGQWRFLDPYAFGRRLADGSMRTATFSSFRDRYAVMGGWMGKQVVGFKNLDEMQDIMSRLAVVAHKKDALDLPPTLSVPVPVHLSVKEAKAYEEMKKELATRLENGSLLAAPNRMTQMMRLRQITSGYLVNERKEIQELGTSKIKTARSLIHDTLAGEDRIVVFAHFRPEVERLISALAEKDTTIRVIHGDTPKERRLEIRQEFGDREDKKRIVLIAQMRTMSLAVNELVTSCNAVFLSMSERREDWIQARDRLDRIGQTRSVTFWVLQAPNSVDGVLINSHQQRTDLEQAMLQHIQGA